MKHRPRLTALPIPRALAFALTLAAGTALATGAVAATGAAAGADPAANPPAKPATAAPAGSAIPPGPGRSGKLSYVNDPAGMLQEQAAVLHTQIAAVLAAHPPSPAPSAERKLALFALDALLHDTRLDAGPALTAYVSDIARRTAANLAAGTAAGAGTGATAPLRVHRFYNHGWFLQAGGVTIAIDIIRGGKNLSAGVGGQSLIPLDLMRPIVTRCDALLISHPHNDHADLAVARLFAAQGKPIVAPPGLWETTNNNNNTTAGAITAAGATGAIASPGDSVGAPADALAALAPVIIRPRAPDLAPNVPAPKTNDFILARPAAGPPPPVDFILVLPAGKPPVSIRVWPGHQGPVRASVHNNLYAVTMPGGKTVLHTGDQDARRPDLDWLLEIGKQQHVDILLPHCWMNRLPEIVKAIAPALVLPGHENELGHNITTRESWWQTFRRVENLHAPVIVTAWGEYIDAP
jgi:L-ascorbate metabolism protein UlaG (beta-lactamase superfamily)